MDKALVKKKMYILTFAHTNHNDGQTKHPLTSRRKHTLKHTHTHTHTTKKIRKVFVGTLYIV